jgi:hypothetical protein
MQRSERGADISRQRWQKTGVDFIRANSCDEAMGSERIGKTVSGFAEALDGGDCNVLWQHA